MSAHHRDAWAELIAPVAPNRFVLAEEPAFDYVEIASIEAADCAWNGREIVLSRGCYCNGAAVPSSNDQALRLPMNEIGAAFLRTALAMIEGSAT